MLHLHCLMWLRGAHHIGKLRPKLLDCPEFTTSFLSFIDSIIKCSLPEPEAESVMLEEWDITAALRECSATESGHQLAKNSNQLATRCQI